MTAETIRGFARRQPFVPFAIHMNDGRKFDVKHPDFVAVHPEASATAIVFLPKGRFEFVAVHNVSGIQSEGDAPPLARKRAKRDDEEGE